MGRRIRRSPARKVNYEVVNFLDELGRLIEWQAAYQVFAAGVTVVDDRKFRERILDRRRHDLFTAVYSVFYHQPTRRFV